MGRRPIGRQTTFRMDDEMRCRIEAVLSEKEKFADFVRIAALKELERREKNAGKPAAASAEPARASKPVPATKIAKPKRSKP
jgi:hypothetical protein